MSTRRWAVLQGKKDNLKKDLKETTLSFRKLGERYGVSRQTVHDFFRRQGIERPVKPRGHQVMECHVCEKLIRISKKPHSEFISSDTIRKEMGELRGKYLYHLYTLRGKGLVSQWFGRLRSKRLEKAYAIYFKKRLPIRTIGWRVGLKNFSTDIIRHRALGWDVPPSLYEGRGGAGLRLKSNGKKA
jgi:hypothetical protein